MQTIFIATDRDGCCFAYYAGKPLWDGSDFGVGYGNQFNRYHGPNMPPPGECWEYRLTRKGDIDTDGDPIGWKIVGIGKDGSVLCEKGNGQRRRYLFGDGANWKPSGEAWERLVAAAGAYTKEYGNQRMRVSEEARELMDAYAAYEAAQSAEPSGQQAMIAELQEQIRKLKVESATQTDAISEREDRIDRLSHDLGLMTKERNELQARLAKPEMQEVVRVDRASKTGWSVGDIVRCRHHSGAWRVWRVYGVFLGAVNQESVIEMECLDKDANLQGWACVPEDLLDLLTAFLRPLEG